MTKHIIFAIVWLLFAIVWLLFAFWRYAVGDVTNSLICLAISTIWQATVPKRT